MQRLRNDPMILVAVVYLICESQVAKLGLSPDEFAESLPSPPDALIEAVGASIVNFYPSGRHSHVREVLQKFSEMNDKTDQIAVAKMASILKDTKTTELIEKKADQLFAKGLETIFGQN